MAELSPDLLRASNAAGRVANEHARRACRWLIRERDGHESLYAREHLLAAYAAELEQDHLLGLWVAQRMAGGAW